MIYPHFAQQPGETYHDYTPCFSTAAAAAPPSRRILAARGETALHRAALNGHCAVARAADLCGGHGGRGRERRPWPRKGFRVVLGSGSGEVTEGVRTLAADFSFFALGC